MKRVHMLGLGIVFFVIALSAAALFWYTAFFQYYLGRSSVRITSTIPYVLGSHDPGQTLDVYLPKDKKNFPIVHFVHGGYWRGQDKNYKQAITGLYANVGIALARQGVGVVVQNYRLAPTVRIDEELQDVLRAVSWTLQNATSVGGNGTVYLMGHSAGGHLISLLGLDSRYLKVAGIASSSISGYIALSPVLDIGNMVERNTEKFNTDISYPIFGRDELFWKDLSPATYAKHDAPPFLLLVGERDTDYLRQQMAAFVERLTTFGASFSHAIIPGATHERMVVQIGGWSDRITPLVKNFITATGGW